jgi:hypothetical protein
MADKLSRHGDGVSVSLHATKVAESAGAEARVANLPGRFSLVLGLFDSPHYIRNQF